MEKYHLHTKKLDNADGKAGNVHEHIFKTTVMSTHDEMHTKAPLSIFFTTRVSSWILPVAARTKRCAPRAETNLPNH